MKVSLHASATTPNPPLGNCYLISTHNFAHCFPSLTEALNDSSHTVLTLSSAELQVPFTWEIIAKANYMGSNFTERKFH